MMASFGVGLSLIWIVPYASWGLLAIFVVIYVVADVHGRRTGARDRHLAAKVVAAFVATAGTQTAVSGAAVALAGLGMKEADVSAFVRGGLGAGLGGALAALLALGVYRARLAGAGEEIGRQALGVNAVLFGAAFTALAAATGGLVLLPVGAVARLPVALAAAVYLVAAAAATSPLLTSTRRAADG